MTEQIDAFDRSGRLVKTQERKSLLKKVRQESDRSGDASLAVPVIHLVLTNPRGELFIVQRADSKDENPGRWCKSVGGHVVSGDSYITTLQKEARQELEVEIVVSDAEAYPQVVREADLHRQAVVRLIDFDPWQRSVRLVSTGESWVKRTRTAVFAGMYDGPVKFRDGEAKAYRLVAPGDLSRDMRALPETFTYDLFDILDKYSWFLRPVN